MYISRNPRLGIGTELLQKITPIGPIHKASVVGRAPNGEEVVLDHPKGGNARFVTVKEFVSKTQTYVGERGPSSMEAQQAIQNRALQLNGTPYNLLTHNCEHVTNYVRTGKSSSPQLGTVVALVVIVVLFCMVAN